jgi:hypothetical protein
MNMYMAIVLSLHIEAADTLVKARDAWNAHKVQYPTNTTRLPAWLDEDMRLFESYESASDALEWLRLISPLSKMPVKAVAS